MTGGTFKPGAKLRRISRNVENPSAALRQVGALLVASSQAAFRDQEFNRRQWPARAPVNVFGILADLSAGRKPPNRRLQTRPALRDTGRLQASISFQLVGDSAVEVGTVLPYAAVHQRGGPVQSATITSGVQKALARWLKGKPSNVVKRLRPLTNPQYTGKRLNGEVPARPFIGLTPDNRRDIREAVGIRIVEDTRA